MEAQIAYEIIGYVASVLIAVSMMMSQIVKLRIVNMTGAAFFSLYGVLITSVPVAALNGFIVLVNAYYLIGMMRNKEYFKFMKVRPDSDYLQYFLKFYKTDILKFQPDFNHEMKPQTVAFFVLRDMVPAGVVLGEINKDGIMQVRLDFVIPNYRDMRVGQFVFQESQDYFREEGLKRFEADPGNEIHQKYLTKIGFKPDATGEKFVLNLSS